MKSDFYLGVLETHLLHGHPGSMAWAGCPLRMCCTEAAVTPSAQVTRTRKGPKEPKKQDSTVPGVKGVANLQVAGERNSELG